jgi:rhamnogalacturonan endolyase
MATRRALLGSAAAAVPALALAPVRQAGVQLTDNGDTVTLTNAAISVTVVKATAQIPALKLIGSRLGHAGVNLVSGTNGQGYTTVDYYVGTTRFSKGLSKATYRVVSQSDDRVEIAMSSADPAVLPFTVDVHMAVERDTPGLYCYLTFGYPDGMPDGLTIQQLRYAVAAGDPSFTAFVVDDRRGVQHRPTIAEMAQAVTLQDTTYRLPDGRVYSKYQNISDLEGDNHVFLISNGQLGLALVQADKDNFAGAAKAPLTRGNTVDDGTEPMGGVMYDTIALRVTR